MIMIILEGILNYISKLNTLFDENYIQCIFII